MRINNKEYISLNRKELESIAKSLPNDQELGEFIRNISRATDNNPEGTSVHEPESKLDHFPHPGAPHWRTGF
jgi:hypothetical protein